MGEVVFKVMRNRVQQMMKERAKSSVYLVVQPGMLGKKEMRKVGNMTLYIKE